jgi:hypothetical protein
MTDRGEVLRLALKSPHGVEVADDLGMNHLDRAELPEFRMEGEINGAHAAGPEFANDLESTCDQSAAKWQPGLDLEQLRAILRTESARGSFHTTFRAQSRHGDLGTSDAGILDGIFPIMTRISTPSNRNGGVTS